MSVVLDFLTVDSKEVRVKVGPVKVFWGTLRGEGVVRGRG